MSALDEYLTYLTQGERYPKQPAAPIVRPQVQFSAEEYNRIVSALALLAGAKQESLVSGTNIKTINGEPVLGDGNIEIKPPSLFFEIDFETGELMMTEANLDGDIQFAIDEQGNLTVTTE